ncbi:MAG: two-component regulator propeller domain-containing protein [Saprospiraceae bacterium]
MKHRTTLATAFLICCLYAAQAQPVAPGTPAQTPFAFFEHFGEAEGVPDAVRLIRQDHQGYLWCVLQPKGLLRFDGVRFRAYANDPDDPNSLPNNSVDDMLVDHSGHIWLATRTGMVRFDPISERFSSVSSRTSSGFSRLLEDHNHRIWAATLGEGLAFFDAQRDSMVVWKSKRIQDGYTEQPSPRDRFGGLNCMVESADGMLWFDINNTTEYGVAAIDPRREVLLHFPFKGFLKNLPVGQADIPFTMTLFSDEKNKCLWMGGYGPGLLEFSTETHVWQWHDLNPPGQNDPLHNFIYHIQHKNDSTLWLATDTGLKVFSTARSQWAQVDPHPTQAWEAQKAKYFSVFRDRAGTTWFGTNKGLSRLDPYRQQFPKNSPPLTLPPSHTSPPSRPLTFQAQAIAEYAPTQERLFAAWSGDGFFRVFAQHLPTGKIRRAEQRLPFRPNDEASVHQLFVAPDGRIWVLLNRGIGWLDPATLRLSIPDLPIANHSECRTPNLWPRQMTADADGSLWIATFGSGIVRYTPSTGQFWRPPELPELPKQRDAARREFNWAMNSVFCDPAGRIFMAENGTGLEIWDRAQQTRAIFMPEAKNNRSFGGFVAGCIAPDAAGNLWFGTESGLCRYLPDAPPDSAFERVKGLQELVFRILPDAQGRLWLSTNKGLVCYDPQRKSWKKFGEKEGMVLPITERVPLFGSSDGEIWLGSDLHFNPASIVLDPPAAVPLITGFKIYDRPLPLAPPTEQGGQQVFSEIRLGPDQEVFSIEIGTLGFTAPEQTRLLYRLRSDDPWQEAGAQRAFTFNRLPGGRYRFELKAIAPDGSESGRSAVLPLRVVPPFYRAVWFWLLCLGAVGGGLYAIFRYREIQRLRQEQLRLRIARDLHDEVGSTLSSISILSASALHGVQKDLDTARFGNIGDKARAALDSMSDIVWSVNPENDPMEKALARMSAYASEMLENVGMELHFEVGEGVESLTLPMEKRKDFYLIFKEAVHNCAKYARAKQVEVALKKEVNTLTMTVKDDGVGFEISNSETKNLGGNGLRNMRSRAAALGGSLEVVSELGAGTEVRLTLPV